jgi:5-methyltetrahydropteroyltriglutamate--homocysteine methyltransferase
MGSRILTHNLGYPRMGALRELKKSLEAYWKGRELEVDLHRTASDLRRIH